MNHLKNLLKRHLRVVPTKVAIIILVVALLGFADATYLTVEHFQNRIPPCSVGGCEVVLTSAFSTILGVPVSLLGAIYYLLILVGVFAYIESKNVKVFKWTLLITAFGFGMSLWFLILQAFVLKAYCYYCLGSALTSTVLFILAMWTLIKYRALDTVNILP